MKVSSTHTVTSQGYAIALLLLVTCTSACFIRNCPMGGKRSLEHVDTIPLQRKCLRCGPGGMGQCIGPNICCGAPFGCYMSTDESATCLRENDIPTPCQIEGAICGDEADGVCVAESLCCNDGQCRLDEECRLQSRTNSLYPDTIHYLKTLLMRQKSYVDRR